LAVVAGAVGIIGILFGLVLLVVCPIIGLSNANSLCSIIGRVQGGGVGEGHLAIY
jgi:hypothetical protein